MVTKVYEAVLWFLGFAKDEQVTGQDHITDMLRRQKERLGKLWWFGAIIGAAFMVLFPIWLLLHVIGIPPFGKIKKGDDHG